MCLDFSQRQVNITSNTSHLPLAMLGRTSSPPVSGNHAASGLTFLLLSSWSLPSLQLEGCPGLQAVGIPALKSGSQGWLGDRDLLPTWVPFATQDDKVGSKTWEIGIAITLTNTQTKIWKVLLWPFPESQLVRGLKAWPFAEKLVKWDHSPWRTGWRWIIKGS